MEFSAVKFNMRVEINRAHSENDFQKIAAVAGGPLHVSPDLLTML